MQTESFIIGLREFTCVRMNAFEANTIFLRLQKLLVPVMGTFLASTGAKGSKAKSLLDMDIQQVAQALSSSLNEDTVESIVLPMFNHSKVFSVDDKKFVRDAGSINQCFTSEQLFDFYELVARVCVFQFSPFFQKLMERFGDQLKEDAPQKPSHQES